MLSAAPSQTHSRDPQLPGTPLRSRDRRPRGARCCGHTNSREGVLRSRHAHGWSTRSCVLVLCSLVPWYAPMCPGTVPLRAEDCHCPTPNGNKTAICDIGHPMTSNRYHRYHTVQELLSRYSRPPGRFLNSRESLRSATALSTPGTRVTPRTEA